MRLIIWGTGTYYRKYISLFEQNDILFLVDSNVELQGKYLDGKIIYNPEKILFCEYDYIILFVKDNLSIRRQLQTMGIDEKYIKDVGTLGDVFPSEFKISSRIITVREWINEEVGKKILVCIPGFSLTGVPVVAKNLCSLLGKIGTRVLLAGYGSGPLEEELRNNDIDYLNYLEIYQHKQEFMEAIKNFDEVIICSTVMSNFGNHICDAAKHIIWWLHESDDKWYEGYTLPILRNNIHYYGVGERVIKKFREKYPTEPIDQLPYFLPNIELYPKKKNQKMKFAVIGTLDHRKAQDLLIEALLETEKDVLENLEVYFIGSGSPSYIDKLTMRSEKLNMIYYMGELTQKEIEKIYKELDVLVCPSRDDPLPVVVSQAMQNGVPCLISDQVGQSFYAKEYMFGKVFQSENIEELKEGVKFFANISEDEWEKFSDGAKLLFENTFSESCVMKKISSILGV